MKLILALALGGEVVFVHWAPMQCHVYQEYPEEMTSFDCLLLVTGLNELVREVELYYEFGKYGEITNLKLISDGFIDSVEVYALIEYKRFEDAWAAILGADRYELLGQTIFVNWGNKMLVIHSFILCFSHM